MSAFCVFAITRESARREANVRSRLKNGETPVLLEERRQMLAARFFDEATARKEKVSEAFDAPQFARDWIACAAKTDAFVAPEVFALESAGGGGYVEAAGSAGHQRQRRIQARVSDCLN